MRKRNSRKSIVCLLVALLTVVCVAFGLVACAGDEVEPAQLESPSALSYNTTSRQLSWVNSENAQATVVIFNGNSFIVESDSSSFSVEKNGGMPSDGILQFTLYHTAKGFKNSDIKKYSYTYKAEEAIILPNPELTSFTDGVLTWSTVDYADGYVIKVNGNIFSDNYQSNTLDTKTVNPGYESTLSIATRGDGLYYKNSNELTVVLDAARSAVKMPAPSNFRVENGILKWNAVTNACEYKVIDLLTRTVVSVTSPEIDLTLVNLAAGVRAVSSLSTVGDSDTVTDIPYLEGTGRSDSPYLIKTPFDLRAIDFYEADYAQKIKTTPSYRRNNYKIVEDLDYAANTMTEGGSNIFRLKMPFYGTLDGDNKCISNLNVVFDGGYWAMFEFVAPTGVIKNLRVNGANLHNGLQSAELFPVGAETALIAYNNYGVIDNITVSDLEITASGGAAASFAISNYGTISSCTIIDVRLIQESTGRVGQSCYEMAGFVIRNLGLVENNKIVGNLEVRGNTASGGGDAKYNNIRCVGGFIADNEGVAKNNVSLSGRIDIKNFNGGAGECGGIAAYNAGTIEYTLASDGSLRDINSFTVSLSAAGSGAVLNLEGSAIIGYNYIGRLVGKNIGVLTANGGDNA